MEMRVCVRKKQMKKKMKDLYGVRKVSLTVAHTYAHTHTPC